MHILILTHAYPPEIRSTSTYMAQLAEDLVRSGHRITVLTPLPRYNVLDSQRANWSRLYQKEVRNGVNVLRIATLPIHMVGPFYRALGYVFITLAFLIFGLVQRKIDLVFAYSTPFTLGLTCIVLKWLGGTPFVFNVQDLFPQNAIDLGLLKSKLLIWLLRKVEIFIYGHADAITVHSHGNQKYIQARIENKLKVLTIPNWVDTDSVYPLPSNLSLRKEWGLDEKFVVLFAGVMGYAQDLDIVLQTALLLKDHRDILFLLVGDGPEKPRLMEKARGLSLENVQFKALVGENIYPLLLASANVCLVTLRPSMKTPVVPSKIFGYFAAAKPVLGCLNSESDACVILERSGGGQIIKGGEAGALAEALSKLEKDRDKAVAMGRKGRLYVETNYSRKNSVAKYKSVFNFVVGRSGFLGTSDISKLVQSI